MRIAAVQTKVAKSVDVNLRRILHYMQKAARQDVDIVCFCETTLHPDPAKHPRSKQAVREIKKACKANNLWCIFGAYVPYKSKVKNVTYVIDRNGKKVYSYEKMHLWNSEVGKVVPGKSNRVLKTEFGKIAIINCWDFAFPEEARKLSRKGAKVIFCPSYLVGFKKDGPALHDIPLVRAFENLAYYVSVDACSKDTLSESYICHPMRAIKKIKGKEGMIIADLDLNSIDELRTFYNHV